MTSIIVAECLPDSLTVTGPTVGDGLATSDVFDAPPLLYWPTTNWAISLLCLCRYVTCVKASASGLTEQNWSPESQYDRMRLPMASHALMSWRQKMPLPVLLPWLYVASPRWLGSPKSTTDITMFNLVLVNDGHWIKDY